MTSTNNRTINGYETIEGELVLSEITNQVLATDSDGLVYGINNYISNLTSDVQAQINTINTEITTSNNNITTIEGEITTINTTLANKQDLSTAANKLDMAYVGSGNVSSGELDMNIENTTFNIKTVKRQKIRHLNFFLSGGSTKVFIINLDIKV